MSVAPLAVGCGRKAPGPDECHDLALRWVASGAIGTHGRIMLRRAPDEDEVLRRTTLCLTTPYDRALVACVQAGGGIEGCYRAFEFRRRGMVPAAE